MLPEKLHFSPLSRRLVEASFTGGHITSDAGLLLLREVDRQHGLTRRLAKIVPDRRDPGRVQHGLQTLLAQRIYALAAGYEDLNDHDGLRHDYALQTAVNRLQPLAGKSTLGRLEQQADRETVVQAHRLLWEHFIAQHDQAPAEIVLDFDATDVPVHGDQEGRFFHGYYDHYCFLPLYVFCGRHLLVSYLRPSNIDGARHSWAILALLVKFIRRFWPETRIVFRGDGGFCRHRMLDWCDRKQVDYVVGLARNTRLQRMAAPAMQAVAEAYQETGQKMSGVYRFLYQAGSWRRRRLVVSRLEHGEQGANPRFIVVSRFAEDAASKQVKRGLVKAGAQLKLSARMILNPGSVGQPRDHDPRASFAILDPDKMTWRIKRVEYDIPSVQERIRKAGSAGKHALRLAEGW